MRTGTLIRPGLLPVIALSLFFTCAVLAESQESSDETLLSLGIDQVRIAEPFHIFYHKDDAALADKAVDVLESAAKEYSPHLKTGTDPIVVVICPTYQAFVRLAGIYGRPEIAGIARSEEGIIIVKSQRALPEPVSYKDTLRHELVHVLLPRNVNTNEVPRWLNEGLAMVLAGEHRWESGLRVGQLYLQDRLISYRDLLWVLEAPGTEGEFSDAYAQSYSMTHYLLERMGEDDFWAMLKSLDNQPFHLAMREYLGMSPAEFALEWKGSLWKIALVFSIVSGFSVFQLMALLAILAYIRKKRRNRAILRQWEREERAEEEEEDEPIPIWELYEGDGEEWKEDPERP